jgi:Zn finger protein HypA/HybF involved in hydrogenase expression
MEAGRIFNITAAARGFKQKAARASPGGNAVSGKGAPPAAGETGKSFPGRTKYDIPERNAGAQRRDLQGEVGALHEYSLMQNVIATILAELKKSEGCPGGPALEVDLSVGALAIHSEAATRQAFEVLTQGTLLENSRLHLTVVPVTLACGACGYQGSLPEGAVDPHDPSPLVECPRCGALAPVQGSRGVESIELRWD